LRRLRLLVRLDTVLRWHRDLMKRHHARTCRPKRPGRPPTVCSIRALILRLVRENPCWGYRRVHGELTMLGIMVAPSTVWEILKQEGVDPAPERASTTWADFLPAGRGTDARGVQDPTPWRPRSSSPDEPTPLVFSDAPRSGSPEPSARPVPLPAGGCGAVPVASGR
jgi:transposase